MQGHRFFPACLLGLALVGAGCASTSVTDQQLVHEQLPRPDHIWVYAFAATPDEVPSESAIAGEYGEHPAPQTAEQIATGRKLGTEIAARLVQEIRTMGMPGEAASAGTQPQINDIVLRGYLLSITEGSAVERVTIGFGAGTSDLRTAVEGFQMTDHGLRKLGSGTLDAGGSKGPGAALGAATFLATANPAGLILSTGMKAYGEASGSSTVEGRAEQTARQIADVLQKRFEEQGWIE